MYEKGRYSALLSDKMRATQQLRGKDTGIFFAVVRLWDPMITIAVDTENTE